MRGVSSRQPRSGKCNAASLLNIESMTWRAENHRMANVWQLKRRGHDANPLRCLNIPSNNGKQHAFGIPCIIDKAQQSLILLALEPISETAADKTIHVPR